MVETSAYYLMKLCVHDVLFLPASNERHGGRGWGKVMKSKNAFLVVRVSVYVCWFFFYYYCLTTIFNIFLSVHLGGAGCQTEGREDTSRPGKNQRGTGQKGRTTFVLLYTQAFTHWLSFSFKRNILTHYNRCLVIFTAHCISLWTSFTARRWSAEKIGHCSVWLCVCI